MTRTLDIKPAVRQGQKARVAIAGPAGGGKTWTALVIAKTLAGPDGRIIVIDTERGSASLYADEFAFDTVDWQPPYDPRELAQSLGTLGKGAPCDVAIVDSLSHFWQGEGGTLDIVDAAGQRAHGNKFAGWKVGTPAQNDMVEALLSAVPHVIVTMRSKMEYVLEEDNRGKKVPRKVGMAPVQRDAIEYEFTVTADIDTEHRLAVTKTRCHPLADKVFQPGKAEQLAKTLKDWLESGAPAPAPADQAAPDPGGTPHTKERAQPKSTTSPASEGEHDPAERPQEPEVTDPSPPTSGGRPADDDSGRPFTEENEKLAGPQFAKDFAVACKEKFGEDAEDWRHALVSLATKDRTRSAKAVLKTDVSELRRLFKLGGDGNLTMGFNPEPKKGDLVFSLSEEPG